MGRLQLMNDSDNLTDPTRVLLVDDDLDFLAANTRFLRLNNYTVEVANNADAGLDRLEQESVDVILTDLRMPDKDGIEFAREARTRQPLTPILFFSGFARVPDVVEAMKLGAVDFLEKPVDPDELLRRLADVRDRYRGTVALQRVAFDFSDSNAPFKQRVLAYEKYLIEAAFLQHKGSVADVLESLKLNRRTLNEKMSRLGIVR